MPVRDTPRVYWAALKRRLNRLTGGGADPYLPLPDGVELSAYPGHRWEMENAQPRLAFTRHEDRRPEDWQRDARAKLAELTGWPFTRPAPALTLADDWVPVGTGIRRRAFYLRVRPETDIVPSIWSGRTG